MTDRVDVEPSAVTSEDKTLPIATYVLYLLSFVTGGLTGLVGLILAYVSRPTASTMAASHYTFLIRTFWIGLITMVIAGFLMLWGAIFSFILIGIPFLILGKLTFVALGIWFVLRCAVGLVNLSRDQAYPRPNALVL